MWKVIFLAPTPHKDNYFLRNQVAELPEQEARELIEQGKAVGEPVKRRKAA